MTTLAARDASLPVWLDPSLYPFTLRRFTTDDGSMSYVDEGRGPVVLFVHGTPSWSFEWRHVIAALRKTHRCIAPDHLGFGLSDKPRDRTFGRRPTPGGSRHSSRRSTYGT